jgi:hypothetical protein
VAASSFHFHDQQRKAARDNRAAFSCGRFPRVSPSKK